MPKPQTSLRLDPIMMEAVAVLVRRHPTLYRSKTQFVEQAIQEKIERDHAKMVSIDEVLRDRPGNLPKAP